MTQAIRVHNTGGPEALIWQGIELGSPGPDQVRLTHTAIGVNFIDVYQRNGLYPVDRPFIPGSEGVGIVEVVGEGVESLKPGDRVAYAGVPGSYCESRLITANRLIKLPDEIDDATGAGAMLKGLTAEYLLRRVFHVGPGHDALFHAAAGGVGLIACQWANALGATVIGTVGSEAKAALARANGCHHTINYNTEDFVERVRDITDGRGADVVYDSVGTDTFPGSLDALKTRGMWVTFGQSSGPVPEFSPLLLMRKGSLFATRPTLVDYITELAELEVAAAALFEAIVGGDVRIAVNQTFPLAEAAEAHRALEGRGTTGSTVLIP